MSPGYYRKLLLRELEKLAGNFLKQNNSKQNKGTSFMRGAFFLYNFFGCGVATERRPYVH